MNFIRDLPIRRKVMGVAMLTAGVALLLTCGALLWFELNNFRGKLERDVATLAKVIGANSVAAVSFGDREAAAEMLSALRAEPQIRSASIYGPDGGLLAIYRRSNDPVEFPAAPAADGFTFGGSGLTYFGAIDDPRERARLGTIFFEADFGEMRRRMFSYGELLAVVLAGSGLAAFLLSARLQRYIAGPIVKLARTTRRVSSERDYSLRVPGGANDELGQLTAGFNEMLAQIQTRDAALRAAHDTLERRVEERTAQLREEVVERARAEEDLAHSLSLVKATLDSTADGILVVDRAGKVIGSNRKFSTMWRIPDELMAARDDRRLLDFVRPQLKRPAEFMEKVAALYGDLEAESSDLIELVDGRLFERYSQPHRSDGVSIGRVWSFSDITERKKLEAQFLRSQRMESIGTLAGGIAHDLNNVLAPIMMSVDLLRQRNSDPAMETVLDSLGTGVNRGADLVRQILCFARGAEGQRVPLQAGRIIQEVFKIARDTFPKNIALETAVADDLWTVCGDATQLHQVLLNLCVNARDAMPAGGTLTITADNFRSDGAVEALRLAPAAGPHLLIRVRDTGEGIPAAARERIFEPFFTTKEAGKGTGLGLSTAIGIVKGYGGQLDFTSEVGAGTTFTVCLPAVPEAAKNERPEQAMRPLGAQELVLVVDDESSIRLVLKQTLESFGYRVLTAADGMKAVATYTERQGQIALVLTDMMMPGMDGNETIRAIKKLDPKARIVAATGLVTDDYLSKAADAGAVAFLRKPYSAEVLLRTLNQVLTGV